MATKKKLLQAAAGSAGGEVLNVEQVFSTHLYDGNNEAQAIENGINLGQSNDGTSVVMNLYTSTDSLTSGDDTDSLFINDNNIIDFGTGDFTFECWLWAKDYGGSTYNDIAGGDSAEFGLGIYGGTLYYSKNGVVNPLQADVTSKLNQWMHIAVSRSSGTSKLFVDGVEEQSTSDTNSFASANGVHIGRLGTRTHRHQGYISNVRIVKGTGIYTSAFTPPTSELTAVSGTALLLCNGDNPLEDASSNSHSITKQGSPKASTFGPFDAADAGEGGMVWIKSRTSADNHLLYDTERGVNDYLKSNNTDAEATVTSLSYFNSNGFTVSGNNNYINGLNDYVSWTFRKAPKFFDVVTYTGTGSVQSISHNLGSVPGMVITKKTGGSSNWAVYHRGISSGGETGALLLNSTAAFATAASVWNNTAPTSTHFTVGSADASNISGQTYVAYLFAHNDGDGNFGPDGDADIIKCGSYTGTNVAGLEVDLGFEPQWLLLKSTAAGTDWKMYDNMRGISTSLPDATIKANELDVEFTPSADNDVDLTATGFVMARSGSDENVSGTDVIYVAIRRGPMAVPTDATELFAIDTLGGTNPSPPGWISNFPVDMSIYKHKGNTTDWVIGSRLTQNNYLIPNASNAETSLPNLKYDFQNGYWDSTAVESQYLSWMWKRAPNYFDVVTYTGTGANRTVSHNLGVAPEMFWVKRRNSTGGSWGVYHKDVGNNKALVLDQSGASFNANWWNSTTPTDSLFYIGGDESTVNASGDTYVAYLFASLDGISKCGSYTGNTTGTNATDTQNIECGFAPRFVFVKATSTTGQWAVWDTARGIVSGNDSTLYLDANVAEDVYDFIDPYSTGFTITNLFGNYNNSGVDYIFYAVA